MNVEATGIALSKTVTFRQAWISSQQILDLLRQNIQRADSLRAYRDFWTFTMRSRRRGV